MRSLHLHGYRIGGLLIWWFSLENANSPNRQIFLLCGIHFLSPFCSTYVYTSYPSIQQVHEALDQQLAAARAENEKIRQLMGEMGVSPRPTVAQWLQQKKQQKKRDMQEALISWDRCGCFAVCIGDQLELS